MKLIVTHKACDLDAIASVWIIKRFLPGWENAEVRFVAAGKKLLGKYIRKGDVIEKVSFVSPSNPSGQVEADVIHVDTGLSSLDHHHIEDNDVCSASLACDFVLKNNPTFFKDENKQKVLKRIVEYAVDDDHFQEVFYQNPTSDIYDFTIVGLIHGIKLMYPKDDASCLAFGLDALDAAFHYFENKIWAEDEIAEKGIEFHTKWGKSLAIETLNDTVLKLGQAMGYALTVRRDPSSGNIRIKARPKRRSVKHGVHSSSFAEHGRERMGKISLKDIDVDLTPVYGKLTKMDPSATWYLHISKRMLLNGSSKNPDMKGSKLSLSEIVEVLQNI